MEKKALYPYTDEHIAKIEAYLEKWKTIFNLSDWRNSVRRGKGSKVMAEVGCIDYSSRTFRFVLGKDAGETVTDHLLEQLVVHELLHIMFHDVKALVLANENIFDEHVQSAEHRIVNVLERLLVPEAKIGNSPDS